MVCVSGTIGKVRETESNTDHMSGKPECGRGSDGLQFTRSCLGLGKVRTKDYHDPCADSSKTLGFFIHTMMEYGISPDCEHVVIELARFLDTIRVKLPLNHHQNQLL